MATKLYNKKTGDSQFFPAKRVQAMLQHGWSATKPKKGQAKPPEPVTVEDTDTLEPDEPGDAPEQPEPTEPVDFMSGDQPMTKEQIRQLAKEKGISNYWNKNLDALKEELGL